MEVRSRRTAAENPEGTSRPDTLGTHTWWLLTQGTVGATGVVLNVGALPARTAHQLHRRSNAEQVLLVLNEGRTCAPTTSRSRPRRATQSSSRPASGTASPTLSPEPVTIASIYGDIGRLEDAGYELHGSSYDFDLPNG